jgi:hypothetical protein
MAKLALIYGMRLFPSEELGEVGEATVELKNGRKARVSMHLMKEARKKLRKRCANPWPRSLRCIRKFE